MPGRRFQNGIDLQGQKATNVAKGTSSTDAARFDQLPLVSDTAPASPNEGDVWIDTSVVPSPNDGTVLAEYANDNVPAAPAGGAKIFGRRNAARILPAFLDVNNVPTSLQPFMARNNVSIIRPNGNSATLTMLGLALTAIGTATAASVATTSLFTAMRRLDFLVTTAAATAIAGFRCGAQQFFRGNVANTGGYHFVCRWAPATGVATTTNRAFCGMYASTATPTDVEPSSLLNIIGMGWDAADTNVQMMSNDGTGVATKVDLGASFPVPTIDRSVVYELALYCKPNDTQVYYQVKNMVSGAVATGSITTADQPAVTTMLNPYCIFSVGGTSSVIGVALMSLYIETDN